MRPQCSSRSAPTRLSGRRSAPTCRSACGAARRRCAEWATRSKRSSTPTLVVVIATPRFALRDGRRVPRLGRSWWSALDAERSRAHGPPDRAPARCVQGRGRGRSRRARSPGRQRLLVRGRIRRCRTRARGVRPSRAGDRRSRVARAIAGALSLSVPARRTLANSRSRDCSFLSERENANSERVLALLVGSGRGRELLALLTALPAGLLQQLLVLLFAHALAALLDQ